MKTYFIFPGQGCQKIGMAKDFYDADESVRRMFEAASDECKIDFAKLLFEPNENINESCFTQPAILLASLASYYYLAARADIAPAGFLGHSLGEFSAICAANMLSAPSAAKLVHARGKFMSECAKPSAPASMMVILGMRDADAEYLADAHRKNKRKIWAANYNCDGQIVLAGLRADLEAAAQSFLDAGAKRAMLLNMSVASHCELMQPAANALLPLLKSQIKNNASAMILANASAKFYSTCEEAVNELKNQLICPVLYKQSISKIAKMAEESAEQIRFIECGANVLAGLNKKITAAPTISIASLQAADEFLKGEKQ